MTQRQYNFYKNTRIVGITLIAAALLLVGFAVFQDKSVTASNLITLAALITSLAAMIVNKPIPPPIQ